MICFHDLCWSKLRRRKARRSQFLLLFIIIYLCLRFALLGRHCLPLFGVRGGYVILMFAVQGESGSGCKDGCFNFNDNLVKDLRNDNIENFQWLKRFF